MKVDLIKEDKSYYKVGKTPVIVKLNSLPYLSVEGCGAPGGQEFIKKIEALYPIAYGVKRICKGEGKDFSVAKLEGLWWIEGDRCALNTPREEWNWRLLIRMPDFVSKTILARVKQEVSKKRQNRFSNDINFENINEGKCAQVMHVGPYADETRTVLDLLRYIKGKGMSVNGLHHEIYLSDPNKTATEKMKTIIRYPVH